MGSPFDNEEAVTRRVVAPDEENTVRMDTRAPNGAALNQDEMVTRHALPVAATSPVPFNRGAPLGMLAPGTVLCSDCVVIRTHHNHESGRPGLFECQGPEGHVMVKVAATDYPPQPELWRRLSELNHPKVLRIFRTHEEEGRFYEIQEFCSGGTLADYVPFPGSGRQVPSPTWVERALVPAFQAGISYLHSQGVVHRDIKPSNLYLREQDGRKGLVIGDFDISAVLQTGRTSRSTERVAGTWVYSAPEAFPRFVDPGAAKIGAAVVRSSDYYSFGVVIVELLLGTTPLHQAQLPDLYDFYLQGGRVEVPKGLPPRLTELLRGLLCRNRHRRWGDEEVERWLLDQTTDEDQKRIAEDRGYELAPSVPAFTAFERSKPRSLVELGEALLREPEIAKEELMAGDVLLNWIGQIDSGVARRIRQDREKWRAKPRMALLCARLHIDPESRFQVAGNAVRAAQEWSRSAQAAVAKNPALAETLCNGEALAELEMWLRLKAEPEVDAAEQVAQIRAFHQLGDEPKSVYSEAAPVKEVRDSRVILEELCYAFSPSRPYALAPQVVAQTPGEIARLSLGSAEVWGDKPPSVYLSSFKRWQNGYLEAYLRQRLAADSRGASPLLKQIAKIREEFADKPFVAFEIILRLLDPETPPLQVEVDHETLERSTTVAHGQAGDISIPYRVVGAGMPFAAIRMQSQFGGFDLESHEITHRQGRINLRLHSGGDVPVGRELLATLSLEGRTTQLAGDALNVRYRVVYPFSLTLKRILIGAMLGAGIMGGARLSLMPFVGQPLWFQDVHLLSGKVWPAIFAILCVAFYAGFRLWVKSLAEHAR